ncbi:hypothetical protein ACHAXT_002052 [Thalassiosira profunda]
MRVLCLHPAASSALQLSRDLALLEERLWQKHGIELVFVDGPLLDAKLGAAVGADGGGITALEPSNDGGDNGDEEKASRRWYVEEPSRRALPQTAEAESGPPPTRYAGLDASLLHLTQVWARGGVNASSAKEGACCLPFQGVLGVGQGADVAGLLPLLNYQPDEEDKKENDAALPVMFQGLQFVVLVDGKDILGQQQNDGGEGSEGGSENDVYVGPEGVRSLHVIMESDADGALEGAKSSSGEQLAKKYGPNAQIHRCKRSSSACPPTLSNILGKFLVGQKNQLHSNPQSRELMSLQNQLANVEQLATLAISQEIQRNPPKALMAVIGPTAMMQQNADNSEVEGKDEEEKPQSRGGKENVKVDMAVGAWHGARRRGIGEEGGGAPCPGEFLLREEERDSVA